MAFMKKIKFLGVLLALLLVTMQSFKKPTVSDWVWFRANPLLGTVEDINEGMESTTAPPIFGCTVGLFFCAEAFSISEGDVSPIPGSSYYHLNIGNSLGILQFQMNCLALKPVP
jgi:hypothetical protein